jgi:hypothetical protein
MEMKPLTIGTIAIGTAGASLLMSTGLALAQQPAQSCAWNKYLYAQDATQQGKIDTNLLNQMSALATGQGYSLTKEGLATMQRLAHGG